MQEKNFSNKLRVNIAGQEPSGILSKGEGKATMAR
jgi:hypothetical protein